MVRVTFWGGVGEIGGNKILVEDGPTRLFLDFGKNYARERRYFDEPYLAPRDEKHLLALDILPPLPGLYTKEDPDLPVDAIVLSHAHTDHFDYIRYLKGTIPIYCSETSRAVLLAREFSGHSPSSDYTIASITKRSGRQVLKNLQAFPAGHRFRIGGVEVEAIPVDHSLPGAHGLLVHTSAGVIAYSGDLRLHGDRPDLTRGFLERARAARPRALIIEGTNIVNARVASEAEVHDKVHELVGRTDRLVMAGFSTVDVDRLHTFWRVARAHGRKLCLSARQAFLLRMLEELGQVPECPVDDPDVLIFRREKKTTAAWEEGLGGGSVTAAEISAIQDGVVLVASFYDMNETVELKPRPGSIYILSQSEPFNEEMEIDHDKLLNWLERYGIPLYQAHASGHAGPFDLQEAVRTIGAPTVYLIHTERPLLYRNFLRDVGAAEIVCPEEGHSYPIT